MHGVNSGESYPYMFELALMRDLSCTYDELLAMPFDLLEVALAEMNARNKWTRKAQERDSHR